MFYNVHTAPSAWIANWLQFNPWLAQTKFALDVASKMSTPSHKAKFTENNVDLDLYYYG